MTDQIVLINIAKNNNSSPMSQNMTVQHSEEQGNVDELYQAIAQGAFFICLSTVLGGVMVLFICLNIIQELKVRT